MKFHVKKFLIVNLNKKTLNIISIFFFAAVDHTYISVSMISSVKKSKASLKRKINVDETCEFSDKDSDVGMRVAKNSRTNPKRSKEEKEDEEEEDVDDDSLLPVKTFEKGEIVVSLDGEFLIAINGDRGEFDYDSEDRCSLGSIEEPDVLEYWEAETIEPIVVDLDTTKSLDYDDSTNKANDHVQMYYRLQDSIDGQVSSSLVTSSSLDDDELLINSIDYYAVPPVSSSLLLLNEDYSIDSCCVAINDSSAPQLEIEAKNIGYDSKDFSRLPIDEAFEVYESCYTEKSIRFAKKFIEENEEKSTKRQLFNTNDGEGPIPCKAVCCNIQ